MLNRRAKSTFYACAAPLMTVNGMRYKWLRAPVNSDLKVHLGPGRRNYLPGWVNVDANMFTGRCDLWADFCNPLPVQDGSEAAFYSHQVIEHLPDVRKHLAEVFRCLRPGGVYRVAGPNGDSAIKKYLSGQARCFATSPTGAEASAETSRTSSLFGKSI